MNALEFANRGENYVTFFRSLFEGFVFTTALLIMCDFFYLLEGLLQ